uniref:Uncharacterized protein n=1 Tax=Chenopodium quinoa TaxID=63459 RepID=A0A803M0M9_CHEQI
MFPFQRSGELSFQTTEFVAEEEQIDAENQIYWLDGAPVNIGDMNTTNGKRSTSDHLTEAVNYIKDLEKNIQELSDKRDQLKAAPESHTSTYQVGSSSHPRASLGSVEISPCLGGLDIDINAGYEDQSDRRNMHRFPAASSEIGQSSFLSK